MHFFLISEAISNPEVKKLLQPIGATVSFGFGTYSLNSIIKEDRMKTAFRELTLAKTKFEQLERKQESFTHLNHPLPYDLTFELSKLEAEITLKMEACETVTSPAEDVINLLQAPSKLAIEIFRG